MVSTVSLEIDTSADRVWEVLADGWLYPLWVVGATRVRDVDGDWPQVGSRIHHSVGVWPLVINDATEVVECDPGARMRLRARGWPLGEAEVEVMVHARQARTEVVLRERAVSGPGSWLPGPVERLLLRGRNIETLRRLGFIAVGRGGRHEPQQHTSGDPTVENT